MICLAFWTYRDSLSYFEIRMSSLWFESLSDSRCSCSSYLCIFIEFSWGFALAISGLRCWSFGSTLESLIFSSASLFWLQILCFKDFDAFFLCHSVFAIGMLAWWWHLATCGPGLSCLRESLSKFCLWAVRFAEQGWELAVLSLLSTYETWGC